MSSTSGADKDAAVVSASPPRRKVRPRVIAVLVAAGLIAAAYGAGLYQGNLTLRKAQAGWQEKETQLSAAVDASTRELSALRSQRTLWQLNAGVSEVLADLADKNYGLARDAAQEMSSLLSQALVDMDASMKDSLQPVAALLEETYRTADALSPDARLNAQKVKALVLQLLGGADTPKPGGSLNRPS